MRKVRERKVSDYQSMCTEVLPNHEQAFISVVQGSDTLDQRIVSDYCTITMAGHGLTKQREDITQAGLIKKGSDIIRCCMPSVKMFVIHSAATCLHQAENELA